MGWWEGERKDWRILYGSWRSGASLQEKQQGSGSRACPEHSPQNQRGRWLGHGLQFPLVLQRLKGQSSTLNSKLVFKMSEIENKLCFYLTLLTFFQVQMSTDDLVKIFISPGSWLAYRSEVPNLFLTFLIITIDLTGLCIKHRVSSFIYLFYWSIVDLWCCVNFYCIAKWFSYTYIFFSIMVYHGILNIVPCAVQYQSLLTKF